MEILECNIIYKPGAPASCAIYCRVSGTLQYEVWCTDGWRTGEGRPSEDFDSCTVWAIIRCDIDNSDICHNVSLTCVLHEKMDENISFEHNEMTTVPKGHSMSMCARNLHLLTPSY